jgi:hypothetical protein
MSADGSVATQECRGGSPRQRDRLRPAMPCRLALRMRLVSPDRQCAIYTDALMMAGLPGWRGARHTERMGNTTSTSASPPDHQGRLHRRRCPPPRPPAAGQTPRLRRSARLPAGPAGRRLEHPPARHPPRHHPSDHPPPHHQPPHHPATPPPAAGPPAPTRRPATRRRLGRPAGLPGRAGVSGGSAGDPGGDAGGGDG